MAVAHSRDARPQMRDPLYSPDWRALSLHRLLEAVADNVAPGVDFRLFPDMERAAPTELASSSALAGAVSGLLPLEDKATAMRIPSWSGKPSAA
jgi:hypothetical protein